MKSIIIFIDYFGEPPAWLDMFLVSCAYNPTITWRLHTDMARPKLLPENVQYIFNTWDNYCDRVSRILNINFSPSGAYSVCNLRPMFGELYKDVISDYDYFGWGDIDVIYGDIRSIYDDRVLSHNVISPDDAICSGHLTLMKTIPQLIEAYRQIPDWRARLQRPGPCDWADSLDEAGLSALFCPSPIRRADFAAHFGVTTTDPFYLSANYFQEQWTTPFTPRTWRDGERRHPETWHWRKGVLSCRNVPHLYLHLMNFKSKRWVDEALYGHAQTWDSLDNCLHFGAQILLSPAGDNASVCIDRSGISLIRADAP